MMLFTIIEKFNSSAGKIWEEFQFENGMEHLEEVISLDSMLCPSMENYNSNKVTADVFLHLQIDSLLYEDLTLDFEPFLKNLNHSYNLIALEFNSHKHPSTDIKHFIFKGYDLIDTKTRIIVLVNCGRLDKAFSATEINEYGLITDFEQAKIIQREILREYPNLSHNQTTLIAIWRYEHQGESKN